VVDSQAELDSALKAGQVDIVLADYENARILQNQIASSSSKLKPRILPLAYKLSKADAKAAEKSFNPIIKDVKDSSAYFGAIYEITSKAV
jgi:ABC-type amino acid transport substrate-binding protein